MKHKIIKWLLGNRLEQLESNLVQTSILKQNIERLDTKNTALESELRNIYRLIGALYDYLEVRPMKTFVQDYSRLPDETFPTTEIIKAEKIQKIKESIKR